MIAFHGDEKIKQKYLDRVRAHKEADEIIKGKYWENGKGCAVGCTIHSGNHDSYETELGIPRLLAKLEDGIFEGLPDHLAKEWPEKFLSSIPVGANLSSVWPNFAYWLLVGPDYGVINFVKNDKFKTSIENIAKLYFKSKTSPVSQQEWNIAFTDAYAASSFAGFYVSAVSVAISAFAATHYVAASVFASSASAFAAAASADYYSDGYCSAYYVDSRYQAVIVQSEKLLELLKECK